MLIIRRGRKGHFASQKNAHLLNVLLSFRHVYSTRTFVVPVVLFTLCYNIPKFFELTAEKVLNSCAEGNDTMVWTYKLTKMRSNPNYIRIYILWMNLFIQILGPFVILTILNLKIYIRIKKFEKLNPDNLFTVTKPKKPNDETGN